MNDHISDPDATRISHMVYELVQPLTELLMERAGLVGNGHHTAQAAMEVARAWLAGDAGVLGQWKMRWINRAEELWRRESKALGAPKHWDWTQKNGRSNSSDMSEWLEERIARLIADSAHDLIGGRGPRSVAELIVGHLAHEWEFIPTKSLDELKRTEGT